MMKQWIAGALCTVAAFGAACEKLDHAPEKYLQDPPPTRQISLEEVAQLLSSLPIGTEQLSEVHGAVSSSEGNGYDSEYRMTEVFLSPGAGVGEDPAGTKAEWTTPLRDLIREAVLSRTKAEGDKTEAEAFLEALSHSDAQIYWPYSTSWDGSEAPLVTFDPGDNSVKNIAYYRDADGELAELVVDEQMARERPVWVVNWNDDASYKSLELLRREDPSWGSGGEILLKSGESGPEGIRTLILRSFRANRQFDSWLAGASEFWVKIGSVEDFKASTEAELLLYQPSITDFMVVVRRDQVGMDIPFNAVLVSEWTESLSSCAFMMIEDDGGTQTSWQCSATVKYNSKSYGFDIAIPLRSRDDIVWRGALSRSYIERFNGETGHFGDVDLVLELI